MTTTSSATVTTIGSHAQIVTIDSTAYVFQARPTRNFDGTPGVTQWRPAVAVFARNGRRACDLFFQITAAQAERQYTRAANASAELTSIELHVWPSAWTRAAKHLI